MPEPIITYLSPLRYPGGKAALAEFIGHLIESNRPRRTTYFEPFAGGAGAALYLLFHEYVERIVLNDLDRGVAAFWRSVFYQPEELIELISTCEVSVDAWREQWQVYQDTSADELQLGFATFFLNRTNRSGILTARPIGGLNQAGPWRIDARFNRRRLSERIKRLAKYSNRVDIYQNNALDWLRTPDCLKNWDSPFVYADPPYLSKGGDLYLNSLTWNDHLAISAGLAGWGGDWLVTYDHDERVRAALYPQHRWAEFALSHSASTQHYGREYMVFSDSLLVHSLNRVGPHGASWVTT